MKRFVWMIAMVTLVMMLLSGCCVSHDMQPATCTEPARCSKCGKTEGEPLGHTEVTDPAQAPTCTETGLSEGSHCQVCGEVLKAQEAIAPLGHTEVVVPAVEPTCTEPGCTEGLHCSVCGEILKSQELIEPLRNRADLHGARLHGGHLLFGLRGDPEIAGAHRTPRT